LPVVHSGGRGLRAVQPVAQEARHVAADIAVHEGDEVVGRDRLALVALRPLLHEGAPRAVADLLVQGEHRQRVAAVDLVGEDDLVAAVLRAGDRAVGVAVLLREGVLLAHERLEVLAV
jgi:hypothetical protein